MRALDPLARQLPLSAVVLLTLGIEAAAWFSHPAEWRGDSLATVDSFGIAPMILGPVAAAATGWACSHATQPGADQLLLAPRGRWLHLRIWARIALTIVLIHLAVIGVALAWGAIWPGATRLGQSLFAVSPQLAGIAFFAGLGSWVGRALSPIIATSAAAITSFALIYLIGTPSLSSSGLILFHFGGSTSLSQRVPEVATMGSHVVILAGLTAAFLIAPVTRQHGRWARGLGLAAPMALLAAAIMLAPLSTLPPRYRIDLAMEPDRCVSGGSITYCYFREHARWGLPDPAELAELNRVVERQGLPKLFPADVYDSLAPSIPGERASVPATQSFDVMSAMQDALFPSWCPEFRQGPPAQFQDDFEYVLNRYDAAAFEDKRVSKAQRDRVAKTLERWSKCDLG